jgi:hypothetical protein
MACTQSSSASAYIPVRHTDARYAPGPAVFELPASPVPVAVGLTTKQRTSIPLARSAHAAPPPLAAGPHARRVAVCGTVASVPGAADGLVHLEHVDADRVRPVNHLAEERLRLRCGCAELVGRRARNHRLTARLVDENFPASEGGVKSAMRCWPVKCEGVDWLSENVSTNS